MYSKLNKSFIQLKVSYVASVYKAFTKDLYSDGCLHNNLEGESYYSFQTLKKLGPPTMLHTKHKVKQGLTTVVALQLFTSSKHRELSKPTGESGLMQ